MSRLQELIRELCPDGVEYKALGEIGAFYGGLTGKSKNDFGSGAKFVTYNNVYGNPAIDLEEYGLVNVGPDERQNTVELGDVLFTISSENREEAGLTSGLTVAPGEGWGLNSFCTGWRLYDKSILLPDFLKHVLRGPEVREAISRTANGVTRFNISKPRLAKVRIPIPPIEVQREVVRILDEYTAAHDELVRQLEEEIGLREQELSTAQKSLTSTSDDTEWIPLKELCTNLDSRRRPVTKSSREPGPYPYYGASGIVDYVSGYLFDGEFLLVAEDGANLVARSTPIAFVATGKTWVNNHAHILEFSDKTMQAYVEMYLNSIDLTEFITGAAQPKLSQKNLNRIPIPVPDGKDMTVMVERLKLIQETGAQLMTVLGDEKEQLSVQLSLVRNQLLSFPEKVA